MAKKPGKISIAQVASNYTECRKLANTADEGLARIQYRECLIPIYVFPEMSLLFPKQNYNVLSPSSYTHISVRDLYISRICLPILSRKYVDRSWENINHSQANNCGNWD
jgi:hypothetical protein